MKVLIAGCGDLGTRAGVLLAVGGHEVWGIRRSPEKLPPAIEGLAADLAAPESIPVLPEVDLVIYALAADSFQEDAYRRAYVDSVRHLLGALGQRPTRRWIHVSSTSVYGQSAGELVDEGSVTEPTSFSGQRILEGERLLFDAVPDTVKEAVVLRLSGIYGPGRSRLLDRVRDGLAPCFEPPVYTNRIHVDDAAGALVHLAHLEAPESLYLGVDNEPVADGDVKRWLAEQLSAPAPGIAPPTAGSRAQRSNKKCSNQRLLDSGYRFLYPSYRAGYGAMIGDAVG